MTYETINFTECAACAAEPVVLCAACQANRSAVDTLKAQLRAGDALRSGLVALVKAMWDLLSLEPVP